MSIVVAGAQFAAFAENHPEIWSRMRGAALTHTALGKGVITEVKQRRTYIPLVMVSFPGGTETFNSVSFNSRSILEVELPDTFDQMFRRFKSESQAEEKRRTAQMLVDRDGAVAMKEARAKLLRLANKYNVRISHLMDRNGIHVLERVFAALEESGAFVWRRQLNQDSLPDLEAKAKANVEAADSVRRFNETGDLWNLVRASSRLRHADLPEIALEVTAAYSPAEGCDPKGVAALLSTRGGAFRDLSKACASEAVTKNPCSFYAYNLLAAIAYDEGDYQQGDEHFERAVQLGSRAQEQETRDKKCAVQSGPCTPRGFDRSPINQGSIEVCMGGHVPTHWPIQLTRRMPPVWSANAMVSFPDDGAVQTSGSWGLSWGYQLPLY